MRSPEARATMLFAPSQPMMMRARYSGIGADTHILGMNGHFAREPSCNLYMPLGQAVQEIVEFATADHQIQRVGRSVIHHKTRRRFEVDFAHPTGWNARERSFEVGKPDQGPRADPAAAWLITWKGAFVEQQCRHSGFAQDFSRGAPAGPAPTTMTSNVVTDLDCSGAV